MRIHLAILCWRCHRSVLTSLLRQDFRVLGLCLFPIVQKSVISPNYLLTFLSFVYFLTFLRLTNHFFVYSFCFLAHVDSFLFNSISVFLGILNMSIAIMANDLSHVLLITSLDNVYSISRFLCAGFWAKDDY